MKPDTATIPVPDWMKTEYDYVVKYDPLTGTWQIVPF